LGRYQRVGSGETIPRKMFPCDAFEKSIIGLKEANARVIVFTARSNRLTTRLITVMENIPKIEGRSDQVEMHGKAMFTLLSVTVEDVIDYYKMLSEKTQGLVSHLLKYGSDEECFCKWNERLQLISSTLGMTGIAGIFDVKVDRQDLRDDVKHLRENIKIITRIRDEGNGISMLLDSQQTNAYKTIQNVDGDIIIKANMIKYDRVLGMGTL
jgi:hypothetical protein